MKNFKFLFLLITLSSMVMFSSSCNDDDDATCSDNKQNGTETGIDCGGDECEPCATCSDGVQNGDETGVDCGGADCDECLVGLQGSNWVSKGDNVALLLAGDPFNVDSIHVSFDPLAYTVKQYVDGAESVLTGSYAQTESGTGNIWNIVLSQTAPSSLVVEGVFEISADGNTLTYEVVQTEPDIGVAPPTAEAGFGSTGGGAWLTWNVQTYVRLP